jgi:hypothetical protein
MTRSDRNALDTRLDAALRALPDAIEPGVDLWPDIEARLEARPSGQPWRWPAWLAQVAAAVLLVAGSSLLTARWLETRRAGGVMTPTTSVARQPASEGTGAMPAAFGPGARLDPEYLAARRQLTAMLDARIAQLPDSARVKLQANLAELRRAAEQINAALAEQPGDPLLEELLLKTYQDELAVLANVNQLTDALTSSAADPAAAKRMQL